MLSHDAQKNHAAWLTRSERDATRKDRETVHARAVGERSCAEEESAGPDRGGRNGRVVSPSQRGLGFLRLWLRASWRAPPGHILPCRREVLRPFRCVPPPRGGRVLGVCGGYCLGEELGIWVQELGVDGSGVRVKGKGFRGEG